MASSPFVEPLEFCRRVRTSCTLFELRVLRYAIEICSRADFFHYRHIPLGSSFNSLSDDLSCGGNEL